MNIELYDITRRFGRNKAVDGVTLDAGPGVSACSARTAPGKTSLLRMLATVLPPSSGKLAAARPGSRRKPADRREIRRRLGYLPQHLGYYPSFTVVEFVEYFALLKEMPPHLVPKAVAAAVERVDLGPKAKAKLRTLSGGMLRRVGIAQAIVNEPGTAAVRRADRRARPRAAGRVPRADPRPRPARDRGGVHPPGRGRRRGVLARWR